MNNITEPLKQYVDDFLSYRKNNKINTCFDGAALGLFLEYINSDYEGAVALSEAIAYEWTKSRKNENSCQKGARLSCFYAFLNYLAERDIIGFSLIKQGVSSSKDRAIPHLYTRDELTKFFKIADRKNACRNLNSQKQELMVPAYFRLLYSTGLRPGEARHLKVDDVNYSDGVISVEVTKTGNHRYVALCPSMLDYLRVYEEKISKLCPNRMYLFPGENGNELSRAWTLRNYRKIWEQVSSSRSVAYDFRHNYAIENINKIKGFDDRSLLLLNALSKSMGHLSIQSTFYYFSLSPSIHSILNSATVRQFSEIVPEVIHEEDY